MGLERRGNSIAYYKKQRIDGRVVSIYVASGVAAIKQYQLDQARAKEEKEAEQKRQEHLQSIADLLGTYIQETDPFIAQSMQELGYHYHRGEWRKRRTLN
jgi:hypothetical protein